MELLTKGVGRNGAFLAWIETALDTNMHAVSQESNHNERLGFRDINISGTDHEVLSAARLS